MGAVKEDLLLDLCQTSLSEVLWDIQMSCVVDFNHDDISSILQEIIDSLGEDLPENIFTYRRRLKKTQPFSEELIKTGISDSVG